MDLDNDEKALQASGSSVNQDAAVNAALTQLSDVLAQLELKPGNVPLLRQQIRLLQQLGMLQESLDGLQQLASISMLDENLWLAYLDGLIQSAPKPMSLDSFMDILERFHQAEKDYLSLAVLIRHVEFIILSSRGRSGTLATDEALDTTGDVSKEVIDLLVPESTRNLLRGVVQQGTGLLSDSHLLWQPLCDWEISLLAESDGDAKLEQMDNIHQLFAERMGTPHLQVDSTASAYSSFCSEHCPEQYESRMVAITELSQAAKTKMSGEKRYGKTREDLESQLAYASEAGSRGAVFASYIQWEIDPRAKNPKQSSKAPSFDPLLTRAVFERAVAMYATAAASAQALLDAAQLAVIEAKEEAIKSKKKGKGKHKAQETNADVTTVEEAEVQKRTADGVVRAYKAAEAGVWNKYTSWLEESGTPEDQETILLRASRACPSVSSAWTHLLSHMEAHGRHIEDLNTTFERALSTGLLDEAGGPTANVAELFLQRAAYESRAHAVDDTEVEDHPVLATVSRAFDVISTVDRTGDTGLKLEKFLLEWAELRAPQCLHQALLLVSKPSKSRLSSHQMTLLKAGVESRLGKLDAARETLLSAIQRSDLDWPEAVYEALLRFESILGSLVTLREAQQKIIKEQDKLARRREKAAAEQMEQYQQQYVAPTSATLSGETAIVQSGAAQTNRTEDQNGTAVSLSLPESATVAAPAAPEAQHMKRDREHCTILVSGLPSNVDEGRVESFFEDCGSIRETLLLAQEGEQTALIEFKFADAVPAALAKHHRKVDNHEISVSMLWRATLFVTNFPRELDDAGVRQMFSSYGTVLQTRWPSRKYHDARRFCYLTMDSPASAQEALCLDGQQTENGFRLSVKISDPSAKNKRTDESDSKLFVGGLDWHTKESELRALFDRYGTITDLKMPMDPVRKVARGIAFIEFATKAEAEAALALAGFHFKGRVLKVELHDPHFANKKAPSEQGVGNRRDRRNRNIRVKGLPEGVQEGLLQQSLEKLVSVVRLEVFEKSREALLTLESAADAGKLLLRTEPFIFDGATISFEEQGRRSQPNQDEASAPSDGASRPVSQAFAPRAMRKSKGIGKGRAAPAVDRALPPTFVSASANGQPAVGQDSFRDFVAAKNEQRGERLLEKQKRPLEDSVDGQSKRPKVDE